ncbi:MAG: amino acid permease [Nanobdellota archaeon]
MVGFKKLLGYKVILLITINSIIGSGMFFLPAIATRYAGPASILSWVLLSVVAIYTAMLLAEMVSMYPRAGGVYEFCKQAYGSFWSFIVGWVAWLVGNITTALLIVGGIQYLIPSDTPGFVFLKIAISLFWVFMFNWMAYRGMKTSAFMLVTFAFITVSIILSLIVPGLFFAQPGNLTPFFIHEGFTNVWMIFLTLFFISEAFFGLESVLFLAEEVKRPEKVLPKALIHGTLIVAVLTVLLVTISLSVVDHANFAISDAPFALVASVMYGGGFETFAIIGTYLIIIGAAAGWVVAGPRLIVALTRDKMFPPRFGAIHSIYNSPYNAIRFQVVVTTLLVLIGSLGQGYHTLLSMLVPLVLVMMSAVIFALIVLRLRKPYVARPYKAPGALVGAGLVIFLNAWLIVVWLMTEPNALSVLNLCLSSILLGIPLFFFLQIQYNPSSVGALNDMLAYLTLLFEKALLNRNVRQEIIKHVGDVKGKTVFEFGCSVGTLTVDLAEEVGPYGHVYATDLSVKSIDITKSRMVKNGYMHVEAYHDHRHSERIHPDIPSVDVVTSVNVLSTIQKVDQVLSDMNARLEVGKPICFVEYDKFFHVIRNINWLGNDSMIKHMFRRNGFLVNVTRKRGLFWEVVFIYGKKSMNSSYKPQDERIDLEELYQDIKSFQGLYDLVKDYVLDLKEKILVNGIGFIFSSDNELDNNTFSVNMNYFEKLFTILFDVGLHYCPEGGDIIFIVRKEGDQLALRLLAQMETHVIVILSNQTEDEGYEHRERKRDISYLKRLVQLGYKGEMEISQIQEDHIPSNYHQYKQFIVGEYEEQVIGKGAPFLKIDIRIPLDRLRL